MPSKKPPTPAVTMPPFAERLQPFLVRLGEVILALKVRPNGALRFGRNGAHVMMVEAGSVAETAGVNGYMSAAAFAIIAAMMTTGVFSDEAEPLAASAPATPDEERVG